MAQSMIAIDPGDRWVGVAFFEADPDEDTGWRCIDAQEFDPWEFVDGLAESIISDELDVVVYERFRLYADKSREQTGSEFLTAQIIGVIKWLVRAHNAHVNAHAEAEALGKLASCELPGGVCNNPVRHPHKIQLVGQMADIKKPARAILNRMKIKSVARPISRELYHGRDHVVDAELHGWKWILDPK